METPILVFVTASSGDEASSIGKRLVKEKLAACVNIIPGMRSLYVWEGNFYDEGEVLLVIKSCQDLLDKIVTRVKELHSYEVPEVIALPIIGGSEDYLQWMEESLS